MSELFNLSELLSCDVRVLIKLEEEKSQLLRFSRLFPSASTAKVYHSLMEKGPSYFDKLAAAYYEIYGNGIEGRQRLNELCKAGLHLI